MEYLLFFNLFPTQKSHRQTDYNFSISKRQSLYSTILISILFMVPLASSAREGAPPISQIQAVLPQSSIEKLELPAIDAKQLRASDAKKMSPGPVRFAKPLKVNINPQNSGTWEQLADGGRIWRLLISVPGATDLNFGFTRYRLPAGGTLHIYNASKNYFEGPWDSQDNKDHHQLWTPLVPGNMAIIELYLPRGIKAKPLLELVQVGAGYRDILNTTPASLPKQGDCNIDTVCPEGDPWRKEIRSAAWYTLEGRDTCSGQLIMDVPGSFRPFFLTANHCEVDTANAPSMVVYWNFESPNCGDLSNGSLQDNQTGASFLASAQEVDFALVELDEAPDPAFNVFYSGWDRSGSTPQKSVGIHHPSVDEKAISFNSDPLSTGGNCIGVPTPQGNTHWIVDNWERGTTEGGSSGSGLWDPKTHKLVGFLSGGTASCSTPNEPDCYGKLSAAWNNGNSASSRLRDWLDPNNEGKQRVAGSEPQPATDTKPKIHIETSTNGEDADSAPGVELKVGDTIKWSYKISNVGDVPLDEVRVFERQKTSEVSNWKFVCVIKKMQPGKTDTCDTRGKAQLGLHRHEAVAQSSISNNNKIGDNDPSYYTGVQ